MRTENSISPKFLHSKINSFHIRENKPHILLTKNNSNEEVYSLSKTGYFKKTIELQLEFYTCYINTVHLYFTGRIWNFGQLPDNNRFEKRKILGPLFQLHHQQMFLHNLTYLSRKVLTWETEVPSYTVDEIKFTNNSSKDYCEDSIKCYSTQFDGYSCKEKFHL